MDQSTTQNQIMVIRIQLSFSHFHPRAGQQCATPLSILSPCAVFRRNWSISSSTSSRLPVSMTMIGGSIVPTPYKLVRSSPRHGSRAPGNTSSIAYIFAWSRRPWFKPNAYQEDPEADFKLFWLSPEPPNYLTFVSIFRKSPRKPWVKELVVKDLTVKTRRPFVEAMPASRGWRVLPLAAGRHLTRLLKIIWALVAAGGIHISTELGISAYRRFPSHRFAYFRLILQSMPMLESLAVYGPSPSKTLRHLPQTGPEIQRS
ncbi:hypothetical protein BDZ89DRAFT_176311 [Hymenopellis radicata]|nr:hypothetical protein BDZ89DRAFT_176311 [Hymenopellis radicata]